jgi:hypothetical protein
MNVADSTLRLKVDRGTVTDARAKHLCLDQPQHRQFESVASRPCFYAVKKLARTGNALQATHDRRRSQFREDGK